ncbi:P-loop containing nucleoside triphosphate hydrolase protein [Guyanagaster necrorhizus]|uniref:P-loop containing nucleoside triphosphate hydrolase protein n=1 Tax=Guyanagaster necrorhizus TaxID=856835 RepID=A0A9P7VZ79_9AGAR|nr:P-loop containing nucleoside triphosphate hydrolase protein [Guyanagaster necrorhizus MCA 3950]KAG7449288.1 P-loop containing nucleoside triphosphate hydrolase protein [Guyanagaster necrorhizus MCA 3950]
MDLDLPVLNASGSVLFFNRLSYKAANGNVLVDAVSVHINAGQMLAVMGPSGAGKSTLLDLMSFRKMPMDGATVSLNDQLLNPSAMYAISSFVEQEDALLGVLTVRETVAYALRLHLPMLSRTTVASRVDRVLAALGLQSCADQIIGTPISRGISGGQKRRVTAACAMVTFPRILFLDEVTSGLDSTSAREVMSAIRRLAVAEGMFVIATIHQPSLETLGQFTDLLLLAQGKICYSGKVDDLVMFFERWGRPVPPFKTPAEHAMNFLNEDFQADPQNGSGNAASLRVFYLSTLNDSHTSLENLNLNLKSIPQFDQDLDVFEEKSGETDWAGKLFWNTMVLSERSTVNYMRNLLAYGVRLGMYVGMGLMIATIWIRLGLRDSTINDRLSIHFYSVAFLAFMSVAGIPSFLEERAVYYQETKNGLYSTLPFVLSNTLVNIPFLFLCTLLFTVICYWAVGLHPGANAFFRFLFFLLLAIIAAESQVLVVSAILPVFVAALAIGSFMNGFWMSVGGYFIKARSLPRFWYYSFHYMDYQRYAFELLTNSDLRGLTFQCERTSDGSCTCAYPSTSSCTVSGDDVLDYLDIRGISYASWVGIMVSIIVLYRIALMVAAF